MSYSNEGDEGDTASTAGKSYAERLTRLSGQRWKKILHVQAPFHANIRSLRLKRTLDVGCGTGRNLHYLDAGSVGVDHNPYSIETTRQAGLEAYTTDQFFADVELSAPASFDSMLCAHVIEHLKPEVARAVLRSYLPSIRAGGRAVFITPQERGFASDTTHVTFADFPVLAQLADELGLERERSYSFPFPRAVGKVFTYNEFVVVSRVPATD